MNHRSFVLTSLLLLLGVTGCTTNIAGTWQGRDATDDRPFSFGAVTFAPDGTYTAEAKYGQTVRAVTGTYTISGKTIRFYGEPFGERTYDLSKVRDGLVFTDVSSGGSLTLDRYR